MIPILMYHQVAEAPRRLDPFGLSIPPDLFERQMSYLARNGYHCLTLPEAVQNLRVGLRPPERSFVLTFDDGYQNVFSIALPILEKFGFTATIFLVAGCMGAPSNWMGQDGERSGMLLTWSEAQELSRRGFILGSHTLCHSRLSLLDDPSALGEIRNSRAVLENELKLPVSFFSYPYSDTDARIKGLVKSAGYSAACAGPSGDLSMFHLWRIPCHRDETPRSFAFKVSGWYNRLIALRESASGRFLRSSVRKYRRAFASHFLQRPFVSNEIQAKAPEREP